MSTTGMGSVMGMSGGKGHGAGGELGRGERAASSGASSLARVDLPRVDESNGEERVHTEKKKKVGVDPYSPVGDGAEEGKVGACSAGLVFFCPSVPIFFFE